VDQRQQGPVYRSRDQWRSYRAQISPHWRDPAKAVTLYEEKGISPSVGAARATDDSLDLHFDRQ
jgi:hypothetical protein